MRGRDGLHDPEARPLRVLGALVFADIRERNELTISQIALWILEPLSFMAVYFVVVAAILNRPRSGYPLFLFCALVPWRYFTGVANDAMSLLARHTEIIRNRFFQRELLPLIGLCVDAVPLMAALVLFVPMMFYFDVAVGLEIVWVLALLIVLTLLTGGAAYICALLGLYFPDFRGITQNMIRASFFASTALVPIEEVPGTELPKVLAANPFSHLFDSFRSVFLYGRAPDPFNLVYPMVVGVVLLTVGLAVYRIRQAEFPKEV